MRFKKDNLLTILLILTASLLSATGCENDTKHKSQPYQFPVGLVVKTEAYHNSFGIIVEMQGVDDVSKGYFVLEDRDYKKNDNGGVVLSFGRRKLCVITEEEFGSYLGSLIIVLYNSVLMNEIEPVIENPLVEKVIVLASDPDVHPTTILVVKPKNEIILDVVERHVQQIKKDHRKEHFVLGSISY